MRLADMLRLYIAANKLEQKTVATEIGISESTLSRFLAGTSMPDGLSFMRVVAWTSCIEMPNGNDIEARIQTLEAQQSKHSPAIQAAWAHVPIGSNFNR